MNNTNNKIYFNNLDGLRFIGSLCIILAHIEIYKQYLDVPNIAIIYNKPKIGASLVTLFFVLSGFLITWLLLNEKSKTKKISLKKFYIRRILRLWPLYFLYLGVLYLCSWYFNLPDLRKGCSPIFSNPLPFFLFHLTNFIVFTPGFIGFAHLWSVSVEEQFYVFWPILIAKCTKLLRSILLFIFLVFFVKMILLIVVTIYYNQTGDCLYSKIKSFLNFTRFECIAIGGLGAYWYMYSPKIINFMFRKNVQIINIICILVLLVLGSFTTYIDQFIISFNFLILVINLALNAKSLFHLKNKKIVYIGKLSYGLYVWHPLAIMLVIKSMQTLCLPMNLYGNIFYYFCTIVLTFIFAFLSYNLFEKQLLKFKPY